MIVRELQLNQIVKQGRSAFLFGPRGVGKTSLVKEFLSTQKNSLFLDLLSLTLFKRYLSEPGLFYQEVVLALGDSSHLTVAVDEVQMLPELLNEVHRLIEEKPGRIQFLLTGSSSRKLKRGSANMLAGRAISLKLHPFTSSELPKLNLKSALQFGTLPAVVQDRDPAPRLRAYVETYIKEEILQEGLVRKLDSFMRFFDLAAQYNSEPINYSKLARACGVRPQTLQDYYSILVDTMLAFRVDAWSYSVKRQIMLAPKYYLFDCGVLNAARGELTTELSEHSFRFGKLFETFVMLELIRANDYRTKDFKFYSWRTKNGQEVDTILSRGPSDRPCAIEIKSSSAPDTLELKGLLTFKEDHPEAELVCLCQTPRKYTKAGVLFLNWRDGVELLMR